MTESKIKFDHEQKNFIPALGLPEGTKPEDLDKGFQEFLNEFSPLKKASERMELLAKEIQDKPAVLITVYHMMIHCLMQSQVAAKQAKDAEKKIITPEIPKIITP